MPKCEKTEKCQFFNDRMESMPPTTPAMKVSYCETDKESCARYQVSTAGFGVPPDLFPHETGRSKAIRGVA